MAAQKNRQWTLAKRPHGEPTMENFKLMETTLPTPGPGQILARTLYLSLDPYMRARMDDVPSYAAPTAIGEVMTAGTVAEVIISNDPAYKPGDVVVGQGGWQEYWVLPAAEIYKAVTGPFPLSYNLGLLGMPGLTAYTGLMRIGEPKAGETVVVAAASGAVGAVVGQIAKRLDCRAVGIAGSADKCRYVMEELGFDACLSHRSSNLAQALKEACPNGIDIYYENVGGKVFEAVLPQLNTFARIPLCGLISYYNAASAADIAGNLMAPMLLRELLVKRIRLQGFIVLDTWAEMVGNFHRDMTAWGAKKPFVYAEDMTEGLENAPTAFIGMLRGQNFGKAVVKVA